MDEDVCCFLSDSAMTASDRKEFVWNDQYEATRSKFVGGMAIFNDIVKKANFIHAYRDVIWRLKLLGNETVLEMGAAHGWASIMLKTIYPRAYFVASDLVPNSMKHAAQWERLMDAEIDEKWAFNSRELPFEDGQFDLIFTFSAFHHFGENGNYEPALREMVRVLKPGGRIVLLYEPASPTLLRKFALRRVNRKRQPEGVDEDVLICKDMRNLSQKLGCSFEATPYPDWRYRDSPATTLYFFLLSRIGPLRRFFVCTTNFEIRKPRE